MVANVNTIFLFARKNEEKIEVKKNESIKAIDKQGAVITDDSDMRVEKRKVAGTHVSVNHVPQPVGAIRFHATLRRHTVRRRFRPTVKRLAIVRRPVVFAVFHRIFFRKIVRNVHLLHVRELPDRFWGFPYLVWGFPNLLWARPNLLWGLPK
jgi:hypothetical protein